MSMDAINSDGVITDETLDKFNNAIDAQIAEWWDIEYPDEWNSLGARQHGLLGDEIRRKLRLVYLILNRVDENSLQGGKRKRRRKTKRRIKTKRRRRRKKGGLGFKNKKPKIKSYNSQKVRNLTYKLAEYDLNHPNKPNLKFDRLASENDKITAYRDEALRQIEKKARNSRNSRRKRLELMKRKIR